MNSLTIKKTIKFLLIITGIVILSLIGISLLYIGFLLLAMGPQYIPAKEWWISEKYVTKVFEEYLETPVESVSASYFTGPMSSGFKVVVKTNPEDSQILAKKYEIESLDGEIILSLGSRPYDESPAQIKYFYADIFSGLDLNFHDGFLLEDQQAINDLIIKEGLISVKNVNISFDNLIVNDNFWRIYREFDKISNEQRIDWLKKNIDLVEIKVDGIFKEKILFEKMKKDLPKYVRDGLISERLTITVDEKNYNYYITSSEQKFCGNNSGEFELCI